MPVFTNTTYICSHSIVAFLEQLKEQYNDKPIAVILDNARHQHLDLKEEAIAAGLGILAFLPPYSLNRNIIERLWKYARKEISNARYYAPVLFMKAITTFF